MRSGIKFPCKNCENNVTNCDHAIQCDLCDSWVHIKCNDLNCIADLPSLHPNYARSLPVLVWYLVVSWLIKANLAVVLL